MIRIKNLTKRFGELKAVDDVTFDVHTGQILGFLGPNGAGKTTTVRIITCYLAPTSGKVEVDGLDVSEHSLEVRKKIGYLPENAPLYSEMNVLDYLRFIMGVRGVAKERWSERTNEITDVCGLGPVINRNIGELSKGFRQRVGLAQAMVHNPDILILDEPTSGLDPNQIAEIRSLIKELGKEKTVILCTHILPEVEATCSRVLIINEGRIVADGSPTELQSSFQGKEQIYLELKTPSEDVQGKLARLENVENVERISTEGDDLKKFTVDCTKGVDLRENLFRLAVENDWILLEMRQEQASLEDVFRQLTTS
ncbi:MAG: ATP-binding cassette domain-containing protein [candidate division Zixibacteria bacterium]|nr:ATP-binding cassette domain-containing protein [candidate division Zixibacteria bacterium]